MRLLLIAAGAFVLAAIGLFVGGLRQGSDELLWWAVASALLALAALTGWRFGPAGRSVPATGSESAQPARVSANRTPGSTS